MPNRNRHRSREHQDGKVIIIGAGLVGSLAAIYMAGQGYQVEVYEKRSDIRKEANVQGRSINLALSERGLNALRQIDLEQEVLKLSVPMKARMLHSATSGRQTRVPYGLHGEDVNSVSRKGLNEILLNAAERMPNLKFYFERQVRSIDPEEGIVVFDNPNSKDSPTTSRAAFILGCDGAYSVVRREMIKFTRLDFSQEYIEHGYKEFCIPSDSNGQWQMDKDCLHIWPCEKYMLIALPNPDGTFTATLFYPHRMFDMIKTREDALALFRQSFPDALQLIGEEQLVGQYFQHPTGPLFSTKCSHYHIGDKLIVLGDAAHAMVPFYGQGMNAGFEDVFILSSLLEAYHDRREQAFALYSQRRRPDAHAICELALYNYWEMSTGVTSPYFRLKSSIYAALNRLLPRYIVPLYTMVAFTNIPYSLVQVTHRRQERIVDASLASIGVGAVVLGVYYLAKHLSS